MTTVQPARDRSVRPGCPSWTRLEFFGLGVDVGGPELPDFTFHFGPHLRPGRALTPATMQIELSSPFPSRSRPAFGPAATHRELVVRRPDGMTILRRPVRGWSNVPPPLPPFAVLSDRLAVTPAVVLAKGEAVVALVGGPLSAKGPLGLALAQRSWSFVSGQLLVIERATGRTLPFLTPLELRGTTADDVRSGGLADGTFRTACSTVSGDVLLVRPESMGRAVPVGSRLAAASVIRLCHGDRVGLRRAGPPTGMWPAAARSLPSRFLELPSASAAEEAAEHLDLALLRQSAGDPNLKESDPCPDASATVLAFPAGSTPSPRT